MKACLTSKFSTSIVQMATYIGIYVCSHLDADMNMSKVKRFSGDLMLNIDNRGVRDKIRKTPLIEVTEITTPK